MPPASVPRMLMAPTSIFCTVRGLSERLTPRRRTSVRGTDWHRESVARASRSVPPASPRISPCLLTNTSRRFNPASPTTHARRIPLRRLPQPQREGQGGDAPAGGRGEALRFRISTFGFRIFTALPVGENVRLGLGTVGVRHLKNGSTTLSRPAEQGAPLPSPAARRRTHQRLGLVLQRRRRVVPVRRPAQAHSRLRLGAAFMHYLVLRRAWPTSSSPMAAREVLRDVIREIHEFVHCKPRALADVIPSAE